LSDLLKTCSFIFLGYKKDIWYVVNPANGVKIQEMSMDATEKVCPSSAESDLYIGRTGTLKTKWHYRAYVHFPSFQLISSLHGGRAFGGVWQA
jgi:hypothetical protein